MHACCSNLNKYLDSTIILCEVYLSFSDLGMTKLTTFDTVCSLSIEPNIAKYMHFLQGIYCNSSSWPLVPPGDWPPKLSETVVTLWLGKRTRFLDKAFEVFALTYLRQLGEKDALESVSAFRMIEHILLPDHEIQNISKGQNSQGMQNLKVIRVLIEGAPGVGKTTLCRKACKEWASRYLWPEYKLVVFVPLRNDALSEATELWQLFDHDSETFCKAVAEEVKNSGGRVFYCSLMDGMRLVI